MRKAPDLLGDFRAVKHGQKIFYRLELICVPHFIACLDKARRGRPTKRAACDCA
jgi:hypothetical protein